MSIRESVFVKRPDSALYHVNVSLSLQNLQKFVDGYIEIVPIGRYRDNDVVMICNEEGKIRGSFERNFWWDDESSGILDCIYGNVLFCRRDGEDIKGLYTEFKAFKAWLHEKGLEV